MRIGIDARTILHPETKDDMGIGHYTYQLIRHLLALDTKNSYVLFFDKETREKDLHKFKRDNVKIIFYPFASYGRFLPGMYNEILTAATLSRENLDVLHVTSAFTRVPVSYRGRVVTTFHDMGVYHIPESYKRVHVARKKAVLSLMSRKADHIIASSDVIKDDLVETLAVDRKKITTVYAGIDERFFVLPEEHTKKIPRQFGIRKKYIFSLGTINPVKNITRLLHAFALFQDERRRVRSKETSDYQLLIAGKPGWLAGDIKNFVSDLDLTGQVKFAGYVIGDELTPLFRNAEFFVLPSLYEGFGSTVLEAFATELPVIASDVGSLPEIAGDAARLVNPVDTKEIANAMSEFAAQQDVRESYREQGIMRARDFNWEKTARETRAIYKSVVS